MVTIISIVSETGAHFKPIIAFHGKQAHHLLVRVRVRVRGRGRGRVQANYDSLPECYLYQRETSGVNSSIVYDWAKKISN